MDFQKGTKGKKVSVVDLAQEGRTQGDIIIPSTIVFDEPSEIPFKRKLFLKKNWIYFIIFIGFIALSFFIFRTLTNQITQEEYQVFEVPPPHKVQTGKTEPSQPTIQEKNPEKVENPVIQNKGPQVIAISEVKQPQKQTSKPVTESTRDHQGAVTKNQKNTKSAKTVEQFLPWELSLQEKQALLKKYKSLPFKNSTKSKFMPIVQDYDKEIKPYIDEFQKFNEVVDYEKIEMTIKEREQYSINYQKKLNDRVVIKQRQLSWQAGYKANPDAYVDQVKRVTKRQMYEAFEYITMIGVDVSTNPEMKVIADRQIQTFQKKYQISKYSKELAMCIVVPSYKNQAYNRYLWNLESIIQQNYTNYRVIIIDDASSDRTSQLIARHLKWRNITKDKVTLVKSRKNWKPMASIFYGSQKICKLGEIQYVVDGDDELVGRQVFKVINALYQKDKWMTIYSGHIIASNTMSNPIYALGPSKDYWAIDIQNSNFRNTTNRGYYHLRTMMSDTVLLMKPESFQDWEGQFYEAIGDNAVYYPAMEMSCKKVKYLPQIFYLYHYNTGQTESQMMGYNRDKHRRINKHINAQKSYRCLAEQFLQINQA